MASICSPLFLGKRLRSATFNLTQQEQAGRRQKAAVYGGFEPRLTGSALGCKFRGNPPPDSEMISPGQLLSATFPTGRAGLRSPIRKLVFLAVEL